MADLQPTLDALATFIGRTCLVSVESKQNTLGAHMQFTGVLGRPEIIGDRVWVPVTYPGCNDEDERPGFSFSASFFEPGGFLTPLQIRIVADGMAFCVFPR